MPFLIAKIVSAGSATHGLCVFGSSFVYQINVTHRKLSLVTVLMVLLHSSIILYQYLWFIHIVTLTSPGYAQGYAVGRNDDAVLRRAVGTEDYGTRVVHNSTATKNTSLQSVRDMMVIAIP